MGAPKGSYNARVHSEANGAKVREALAQALRALDRTGLVFKNVSVLANHLAGAAGQTPGNLRRNKIYRQMLESHIHMQRGTAGLISDRDRDVNTLKAKLRATELDAANSARDKARLQRFLDQNILPGRSGAALSPQGSSTQEKTDDYRMAFECTAQALANLLERAEVFAINLKNNTIDDMSARPGKQEVVSKVHASFYIEWSKNRKVPSA